MSTGERAPYGCLHCTTAGSFKGDVSKMPRTCPTRTHAEVAGDVSGYLGEERQALMKAADSTPFKPDGTLRNRLSAMEVRGSIHAKTGSLRGVTTLSGYMTTKSGRNLVFSIFANHVSATSKVKRTIDEICALFVNLY